MRVKPKPGTYDVTVGGSTFPVVITKYGMLTRYIRYGCEFQAEWEWKDINGEPVAMPIIWFAIHYIGFNEDGTLDIVYMDGTGKVGTYAPA